MTKDPRIDRRGLAKYSGLEPYYPTSQKRILPSVDKEGSEASDHCPVFDVYFRLVIAIVIAIVFDLFLPAFSDIDIDNDNEKTYSPQTYIHISPFTIYNYLSCLLLTLQLDSRILTSNITILTLQHSGRLPATLKLLLTGLLHCYNCDVALKSSCFLWFGNRRMTVCEDEFKKFFYMKKDELLYGIEIENGLEDEIIFRLLRSCLQ